MKDRLLQLLQDIADFTGYEEVMNNQTGIHTGFAGLSLFYYQTYRYSKEYTCYEKALYYFERSFHGMNPENMNLSLGTTGVMWLLNYYKTQKAFHFDFEALLTPYDQVLSAEVEHWKDDLDPMHGALGLANYLLNRNTATASAALEKILDLTDQQKIKTPVGITWKYPDVDLSQGMVQCENMGYAHGLLTYIYFFAQLIRRGIAVEKANDLYQQSLRHFLSFRDTQQAMHFPTLICNGEIRRQERVSYCYGDLGTACGITAVGNIMQDEKLLLIARETACNIAAFTSHPSQKGNDIGLCHGAAGNGYLFHKLYKQFGIPLLKKRSDEYYQKLLSMKEVGHGIAGYRSYSFDKTAERFIKIPDASLLNGTSGIGLCILSFLNPRSKNAWDRLLLLS